MYSREILPEGVWNNIALIKWGKVMPCRDYSGVFYLLKENKTPFPYFIIYIYITSFFLHVYIVCTVYFVN